jgi:hypothetical protein
LLTIYKTIKGSSIDIELTPEIREVFDRLLVGQSPATPSSAVVGASSVKLAYSGPTGVNFDESTEIDSYQQAQVEEKTYQVVGSDSEIGRQMLSEGFEIASPDFQGTASLPHFYSPSDVNTEDRLLQSLENQPVRAITPSEEYNYAVMLLGKNFAQKLFSTGQPVTFADIERHRADLGKPFSFTKFLPKRDLAVSKNSSDKILEGTKTITLRNADARYANKSGLVELEGEIFDFQEIGNLDFKQALQATGMTQQEFAKAFLGEDTGIESIFEESVKAFFDGNGSRRVYTITKLGEPIDPRKRKSKKKPIPC